MNALSPGTLVIGRYQIRSQLGSGGMATVHYAYDNQNSRDVALKILNSDQLRAEHRKERFLREFSVIKKFDHPSVITAYDQHETETGTPFFTMERVNGVPVSQRISGSTPLSYEENLAVLREVAGALTHIHQRGIVYCDLKPANLLISGDNSVKLVDFGISQETDSALSEDEKASMVGTSFYMSPEQIRGDRLDGRSDIYSFGILAFELLTGKSPFENDALFTVTASHLAAKVPSARERNPHVSGAIDRMIRVCLEKDRKNRYQSMEEVTGRLEAASKPARSWFDSGFIKKLRGR